MRAWLLLLGALCVASSRAAPGGPDTAAYARFEGAFAGNDADALRQLSVELGKAGNDRDRQLGLLALAAAAFRTDAMLDCRKLLDSLGQRSGILDERIAAVRFKLDALVSNWAGEPLVAAALAAQGLALADSTELPRERVDLMVVRAEAHNALGELDQALSWLTRAQALAERSGYIRGTCLARINVGNIRYAQDRYDEAWGDYRAAYTCASAHGFTMIAQNALGNLAAVAVMTERYDDALALYDSTLMSLDGRSPALRARAYGQRGYIYAEMGHPANAVKSYDRAIALQDSLGDRLSATKSRGFSSNALWDLGQRKAAFALREQVLEVARSMRWPAIEIESRYRLMDWYSEAGRSDLALEQASRLLALEDSVTKARFSDRLALADVRFETERKELRIAEQDQALRISALENTRKAYQRNVLIGIAVVLLALALLLWRGLVIRKRLAEKERELHRQKVDELMHTQEMKAINAMLEGQEKERDRVAKDLHDRLGSMLSAIKFQVGALEERVEKVSQTQDDQYGKVNQLLDDAVGEVRRISHDLIATTLTRFGLAKALEDLCSSVRVTGRLAVELRLFGLEHRLERAVEIVVYRIVQELVSNVLKHAEATELSIAVTRETGRLSVMVSDDGKGFEAPTRQPGIGLENVHARAASIGAVVRVDSALGKGTTVSVECPVIE